MAKFKGFGTPAPARRTKPKRKGYDPSFSLRFERYADKHLGKGWGSGIVFQHLDDGERRRLLLRVPRESHGTFTEEYQLEIRKLAQKFGVDYLEIELVDLPRSILEQRVTANRPVVKVD
jgi:hypothetical protein